MSPKLKKLKKKPNNKNLGGFLILVLLISSLLIFFNPEETNTTKIDQITLLEQIEDGEVKSVSVRENKINIEKYDGTKQFTIKEGTATIYDLYQNLPEGTKLPETSIEDLTFQNTLVNIFVGLIPFVIIIGFFVFMMKQAQGSNSQAMSFGKSKARVYNKEKQKTTFKDVAGAKEAKEELVEVVDFLKHPNKYKSLGAKIPKGVLLMGSPGTGKTLLARAVAGEANVPFFNISGSEFVEMFVGVGASRVRDLFKKAKRNAPCILFIDEIDAVGRHRGAGMGGGNDEREQTLNQILTEMDGFEQEHNVIVVAATNRPDVLDPALLRPGRFDRTIVVDMPAIEDRLEILKVHARNKPLAKDVDLEVIARHTPGFAGADLENLMNEGAILTARNNKKKITHKILEKAIEKVIMGPERKSKVMSDEEKEITAYHESGHAIVGHLLPNCHPVHKLSVVSRGRALGVTWFLPEKDTVLKRKSEFIDELASLLAGQAAEELVFNEITTGASNDIEKATSIARKMVTQYGMSPLGKIRLGGKDEVFLSKDITTHARMFSEEMASKIDHEIAKILDKAYETAKDILSKNKTILEKLSKDLLKKETIDKKEFLTYFA